MNPSTVPFSTLGNGNVFMSGGIGHIKMTPLTVNSVVFNSARFSDGEPIHFDGSALVSLIVDATYNL